MPFDPIDYRPPDPPPWRPGPTARTDRHGVRLLAMIALAVLLLGGLIAFPYTLEGLSRIADALDL